MAKALPLFINGEQIEPKSLNRSRQVMPSYFDENGSMIYRATPVVYEITTHNNEIIIMPSPQINERLGIIELNGEAYLYQWQKNTDVEEMAKRYGLTV